MKHKVKHAHPFKRFEKLIHDRNWYKWLKKHPRWYKVFKATIYVSLFFVSFTFLTWLFFGRTVLNQPEDIMWGVTYSAKAAEELQLDPQETFRAVVYDLQPNKLRLVAYWNRIEPSQDQMDYSELDYQVELAEQTATPYVIAVGRRTPRYPECHAPEWSNQLPIDQQNSEVLEIIERTIARYDSNPNLIGWQIENEPFVSGFGICPDLDESFYEREVDFARSLTNKTIYGTESGELSIWFKISKYPDVVGTTLYRRVLVNGTSVALQHVFPSWYYRARSNIMTRLRNNVDNFIVAELQAEPWGTKPLVEHDDEFLSKTMNPTYFEKNIEYATNVGFSEVDFWGAEWWYYELQRGNNYYWERAKDQFKVY